MAGTESKGERSDEQNVLSDTANPAHPSTAFRPEDPSPSTTDRGRHSAQDERRASRVVARRSPLAPPPLLRWTITLAALSFLGLLLVAPLVAVLVHAFEDGVGAFVAAVTSPDTLAALKLTLLVIAIAVPVNVVFGLAASWLLTRHRFRGRTLLATLVDLPFSVSPVIAGLLFVLLFGRQGWFGDWLQAHDVRILFAVPGVVLTTLFVTLPLVAREVIPHMQAQGADPEEAALTLGASGWQTFWYVTLPRARWAVLYGAILCGARAMGEFGAVSVVSGHIRGETNTVPLHVEILYNEYAFVAAFAVSTLLLALAAAAVAARRVVQSRLGHPD